MKFLSELLEMTYKDKRWLCISSAAGVTLGAMAFWVSKNVIYTFLAFGMAFAYAGSLPVAREISRRREEKEMKTEFQKIFGLTLSSTAAVRAAVIGKLVGNWQALSELTDIKNSIAKRWEEIPLAVDGVDVRLTLQREYDETSRRLREAKERFEKVCEAAMDAGFREEVRAFGYPRTTVRITKDITPEVVLGTTAMVVMS